MRIAFDAAALAFAEEPKAREQALLFWDDFIRSHPQHDFIFWDCMDALSLCDTLNHPENLSECRFSPGPGALLLRDARCAGLLGCLTARFLTQERIDLFIFSGSLPNGYTPYQADWFAGISTAMLLPQGACPYAFASYFASAGDFSLEDALAEAGAKTPAHSSPKKNRLAFFSPLPPAESGIADYSADLLEILAAFFDIDAITEDGGPVSCPLPPNVRIRSAKQFQPEAYDYILYQMGNSLFHAYMLPFVQQAPGIVMLHDVNLHAMVSAMTLREGDMKAYARLLSLDYPPEVVSGTLHAIQCAGTASIPYQDMPVNGLVTRYAKRILVHSLFAKEQLLRKSIGYDVRQSPHYAHIAPLRDSGDARAALGIAPDTPLICSFGHISSSKRAVPILRAFSRLHRALPAARLFYVGKAADESVQEIQAIVEQEGLADAVTITGFTPLSTFCEYIDAADICLNFRYPENGETSGCLMRFLAKGKCVLLNDAGSFSEIPDECCVKLPSVEFMTEAEEITRIEDALLKLLEDPQVRETLSKNARHYAQEVLDIHKVALQYAKLIQDPFAPSLDETDLQNVAASLRGASQEELLSISKTLAYIKNPQTESFVKKRRLRTRDMIESLRMETQNKGQYA
jgi:glycosyltransferase involved in cell wall biosynthesis